MAHCSCFVKNALSRGERGIFPLTILETDRANTAIIRIIPGQYFAKELNCLRRKSNVSPKTKIISITTIRRRLRITTCWRQTKNRYYVGCVSMRPQCNTPSSFIYTIFIRIRTHASTAWRFASYVVIYSFARYWLLCDRNIALHNNCVVCFHCRSIAV